MEHHWMHISVPISECWQVDFKNLGSYKHDAMKYKTLTMIHHISPHSTTRITSETMFIVAKWKKVSPVIFTTSLGLLFGPVGTFSIFRSVSIPSMTLPKTTCLPSKKSHFAVVMKNCGKAVQVSSREFDRVSWSMSYLAAIGMGSRVRLLKI